MTIMHTFHNGIHPVRIKDLEFMILSRHFEHQRRQGDGPSCHFTQIRVLNVTPISSRCSKLVPQQPPQTLTLGSIFFNCPFSFPNSRGSPRSNSVA